MPENSTVKLFEVVSIKQKTRVLKNKWALHQIKSPLAVVDLFVDYIGDEANEVFVAVMLDTKNQVVGLHKISSGSLNASIVHPREVFKVAILNNAASIIVGHNHPSGHPTPSPEDIKVTERLVECGKLMGIEVLDHLIVTERGAYMSFAEKGYIK